MRGTEMVRINYRCAREVLNQAIEEKYAQSIIGGAASQQGLARPRDDS